MSTPLLVTADETLVDELSRLAAAAGVTPQLAADPVAAFPSWRGAPLVLVGTDVAEALAHLQPGRRDGVYVVSPGRCGDADFPVALALGAEGLLDVTLSGQWLVEVLSEASEPASERARTVGVVGGSGGSGATVFAAALAEEAARHGPTLLVDCDAQGPGLDRVLGLELTEGVRWDALHRTTGRMSGRALRESVPRRGDLGVLTWHATSPARLQPFAVREVVAAAQRGHRMVVVDLPRRDGPVLEEVLPRLDAVVLTVTQTVLGVASATRGAASLGATPLHVVVRGRGGLAERVAEVTGSGEVVEMAPQRGLDEAIDLGIGPLRSRRGPLGRAAREVLERVA